MRLQNLLNYCVSYKIAIEMHKEIEPTKWHEKIVKLVKVCETIFYKLVKLICFSFSVQFTTNLNSTKEMLLWNGSEKKPA
jgi:hypothetical protein